MDTIPNFHFVNINNALNEGKMITIFAPLIKINFAG